ncbi:PspA/IM30 family protein [Corynebacterium sp. 335C]
MPNPFSKGWKYVMSSFDKKIDDNADPKVLLHQAEQEERRRHDAIQRQAAEIIGNRNQLEMQLGRLTKDREKLTANTKAALEQADRARAAGDEAKAAELENTAEVFASQLVSIERELEDTTQMHGQAVAAADEAQKQAKLSQQRQQELKAQFRELEAQADQAEMQQRTAATMDGIRAIEGDRNVPTLDDVREKIEGRYARALGAQELAQDSTAGRMAEIEAGTTDAQASMRLEEIRARMRAESAGELGAGGSGSAAGELESGDGADGAK